ncbi:cutinase family protein [Corynebacterium variabile]|uniref:cutinase family protein n=1 Tax=Corynebacterium variabile TaxID=1727 RepID=UPI003BAE4B6F
MNSRALRRLTITASSAVVTAALITTMAPTASAAETSAAPTTTTADSGETDCPAVHVILAPGTSETSSWSDPNQDNHGYLSELIKPVLRDANVGQSVSDPGAGFSEALESEDRSDFWADSSSDSGETPRVSRTTLTYPSTAGGAWAGMGITPGTPKNFGDTTSYEQSVAAGVGQASTVMNEVVSRCDDTKIMLVGYSQGAEVMSQVGRAIGTGESSIDPDRIAGIALFADPTREGGTPLLADGGDAPAQIAGTTADAVSQTVTGLSETDTPASNGLSPEKTGIADFGAISDRTVSWCLAGDYVCGLPADSELANQIAGLLEQVDLSDPVEALKLVAESMDSAVKVSDFSQVADIDFGEDGFKTSGLVGSDEGDAAGDSVLAERTAAAQNGFSDTKPLHLNDGQDATDTDAATSATRTTEGALPSVDADEMAEDSLLGTGDKTEAQSTSAEPTAQSTTESAAASTTESANEDKQDTEVTETSEVTTPSADSAATSEPSAVQDEPADTPAEEPAAAPVDPLSSPEAFGAAALPLMGELGGMALATGVTVVKDTLTPSNVAQIAVAGVVGGPQAAATVAGDKFTQTGMKLLEPGMASGKAREVLTAVEDAGFTVPETMKLAVELSAWLSVTEHVEYGNRAILPDGRTAEKATQDWILAAASDISGDDQITNQLMSSLGDLGQFGADVLTEIAYDPRTADLANEAISGVIDQAVG